MKRPLVRLLAAALVLALLPALPGLAAAPRSSLPEVVAAPMVYGHPLPASPAVDRNWFSDAVFLGDSRIQDLEGSGLLNGGLWLSPDALNVRDARSEAVFPVKDQKLTLSQVLKGTNYKKLYLMLGVNEASWMDEASFRAEFSALIDDLRALLPAAEIYLLDIIPVTVARAAARSPDNALLSDRSALLRALAKEKRVCLVDAAKALTAASGALAKEYSQSDGLRLNSGGSAVLAAYLRTHTAVN